MLLLGALCAALAGCQGDYSPNTYSATAVQQANKVDKGVIVGSRPVVVSAKGTVGGAAGAAAGGVAGSQAPGGFGSAIGAIGGTVLGGIVGSSVEQATGDAPATEYVVQKTNGELVSVTQKDDKPLPVGQHVLVMSGSQARIVPDYTVPLEVAKPPAMPVSLPPVPLAPPPVAPTPETPPAQP